jgi:hypothetical protein
MPPLASLHAVPRSAPARRAVLAWSHMKDEINTDDTMGVDLLMERDYK